MPEKMDTSGEKWLSSLSSECCSKKAKRGNPDTLEDLIKTSLERRSMKSDSLRKVAKLEPKIGYVPVLVEATLALLVDVLSPDGLQRTEATRGLDIADHTDGHHWRRLDDRHGLDHLASSLGSLNLTDDVAHAGFEAEEGGHMDWLLGVILGEGLDLAAMTLGALLGIESHGTMARSRKLTVRLKTTSAKS